MRDPGPICNEALEKGRAVSVGSGDWLGSFREDIDVDLLSLRPNIQEILTATAPALTWGRIVATALILQSGRKRGMAALGATECDMDSESIGTDFETVLV